MSASYRRRVEELRATEEARAISASHALTLSIGYAHATRHDWRACSCAIKSTEPDTPLEPVWVYMWNCRRCPTCFVWSKSLFWAGGVVNDYFAPTVVTDAELEAWLS